MTPACISMLLAVLLCCPFPVTAQSSFVPKTIQFNGDSDHSNAELLAAAGLTQGDALTNAKLNESTHRLLETGLFEDIRFAYNDQLLAFQVIPATVYPIRLENFPVNFGGDLENRLRARFPLYRGKVPASGSLLNGVTAELQEELSAMKIQAAVSPSLYADSSLDKITAVSFSIVSPGIMVGEIQLSVLSGTMAAKVRQITAKFSGSAYLTESSERQLEGLVTDAYLEQGYLESKVHATPRREPVVDAKGVHIPFTVVIEEGPQYKLSSVQLAPDLIVAQAAFDRVRGSRLGMQSGEFASPDKVRRGCDFIAREYRKAGYLRVQITPVPTFDRENGTVNYTITAQPGPQYTMGTLKIENVDDEMRERIASALNMPPGAPFSEGAIVSMTATHAVNPELERFFATTNLSYKLSLNDAAHTVDVDLTPQKKP
jgi:outer membrane protein assembly factor BamA